MRQQIAIIALVLLSANLAGCNWLRPIQVDTTSLDSYPTVYLDPVSGKKFVFYPHNSTSDGVAHSYLCYKIFDRQDHALKSQCADQTLFIRDVSVSGPEDGKTLFVAFSANRTIKGVQCNVNDTTGCIDVYFMESADAGETWSSPKPVQRRDRNDARSRVNPRLLYIRESKRLYIFYVRPMEDDNAIYQVTRSSGSIVFSSESMAYSNKYPIERLQVAYTTVWSKTYIHLVFMFPYLLTWVYSDNGGVSWKLGDVLNYVKNEAPYAMTASWGRDTLFVASVDHNFMSFITIDFELKVEKTYLRFNEFAGYTPILVSVPGDNSKMIMSGSLENKNVSTYTYDNAVEDLADLRYPAPMAPYPSAAINATAEGIRLSILHKVGSMMYLSTCLIPKTYATAARSTADE